MLIHWIWFATLPQLKIGQKLALLQRFSDPEEIFHTAEAACTQVEDLTQEGRKALCDGDLSLAQKILKECSEKSISILTFGDAAYPRRLKNIADPPLVLYYKGVLPDFESVPVVAVVGTRKATAYGLTTARNMSAQIAACGALVISGAAHGIDAMAMEGAMDAGSKVVGVLGCGVDIVYPKSNSRLFKQVLENGCLMSEYPPGTQPFAWNFPRRNRILSGIASGVLVVEAPEVSGALITARQALEQGRDVFAVPGNIDVTTCTGSNALLQEGASAVFTGWDVVREYEPQYPDAVAKRDVQWSEKAVAPLQAEQTVVKVAQERSVLEKHSRASHASDKKDIDNPAQSNYSGIGTQVAALSQDEKQILACLDSQPRPVDAVIAQVNMPASKVLGSLTMLALKGIVVNHPGKRVSRKF